MQCQNLLKRLFVKLRLNSGVGWVRRKYLLVLIIILFVRRNPSELTTIATLIFSLQIVSKVVSS